MQCEEGHAIRAQVHVGGNDHIHFRAGCLFRRQDQSVDTPQHLLRVAVGCAFAARLHLILQDAGQFQSDGGKASFLERRHRLLHFVRRTQPALAVYLPVYRNRRTEPHPAGTLFLSEVEQGCLQGDDQPWLSGPLPHGAKSFPREQCIVAQINDGWGIDYLLGSLTQYGVADPDGPHGRVGQEDIFFMILFGITVHQTCQCFFLVLGW